MLDVTFTWAGARPADVAVVIDALRATSTITQALAGGYERVLCCDCLAAAEGLRSPDRVVAGERGCLPPAGFDLGNSPGAFEVPRAKEVALATTNGCPAIVTSAESADEVVLASMLNLTAVVAALPTDADILIVCAGTAGQPALEDTYVAGRIAALVDGEQSDAAEIAKAVTRGFDDPYAALAASVNAEKLREVGLTDDILRCASESQLDVVPRVVAVEDGVATVERSGQADRRPRAAGAEAPLPS